MRDTFHHEALSRGKEAIARLSGVRLFVCGAGAVGSNLVDNLVRQGFRQITVVDSDRVEPHNVNTQTFTKDDIGAPKVEVVQAEAFRAVGAEVSVHAARLTGANVEKLVRGADLVIDGFDNHDSRRVVAEHCRANGISCLHVGLHDNYCEIVWNEVYRVPRDVAEGDVCDYPLARNLVLFAVALASECAVRFALHGTRESYSFTMKDLRVNREREAP